jgi:DNA-binding MltR family transcriptional regulator
MWTTRSDKDQETIEEIERQEDRGAAILAGAYLEDRLTLAIKERLVSDFKAQDTFFGGMGPLATFHAKIELSYLMGILDVRTRALLQKIRKIRNLFAHHTEPINFESGQIRDLCAGLLSVRAMKRLKSMAASDSKLVPQEFATTVSENLIGAMANLPDTPRNSYMNTIRFTLFTMELSTHALMAEKAGASQDQPALGISVVKPEQ